MIEVIHEVINTPFQVAMDCKHTPNESDHICWQCTVKIIDMAEAAEARAAALEDERDGWIAKLQAYDEIEKANKALAAELVKLRALYTNCAVALTKHGDQYLTLTVREGIEAMAAELERVKAERDKLAQENAEAVEHQQLKTWYQARMSGDRRGFDEWQAETPLGQALDGLGDEVEP